MGEDLRVGSESGRESVTGHSALFARIAWAVVGPIALVSLLVPVAQSQGWLGVWEAAYFSVVALMIGGRYAEQNSGHGTTLYSEPSTWSHFRFYSVKLVVLAFFLWGAVKGLRTFIA